MECRVSLASELGVNAFEFITAWNRTPACRASAEARLASMSSGAGAIFEPSRLRGHTAVLDRLADEADLTLLHGLLERVLGRVLGRAIQVREDQEEDGTRRLAVSPA